MAKGSRRSRGARADVMEIWQAPKQWFLLQLIGALVRFRAELLVAAVLITGLVWSRTTLGPVWTWVIVAGLVLVIVLVRPARRFVSARMWCVMDRHRLRTCLRNAKVRTMNLDGALPFLLWARPTKTGERVWCWTRAGSSPDDLDNVLGYVASACYAKEARLHRLRLFTTLVAIEVIRRDPLGKPDVIDSPLAKLSSLVNGRPTVPEGTTPMTAVQVTDLPAQQSGTAQVNTVAGATIAAPIETTRSRKTSRKTEPEPVGPSVMAGGQDLSDYI